MVTPGDSDEEDFPTTMRAEKPFSTGLR